MHLVLILCRGSIYGLFCNLIVQCKETSLRLASLIPTGDHPYLKLRENISLVVMNPALVLPDVRATVPHSPLGLHTLGLGECITQILPGMGHLNTMSFCVCERGRLSTQYDPGDRSGGPQTPGLTFTKKVLFL